MSHNPFVVTAVSSRAGAAYRAALETQGFEVADAVDGFEAVDLTLQYRPALIVLDEQLPGLSAISVCAMLKARAATDQIPIIIVCTQHDRAHQERFVEAGADQVLVEPCAPDLLGVEAKRLARAGATGRVSSHLRRRSADARFIESS